MKAFITVGIILLLISCSDESLVSYNEQLTKDIQLVDSYLKANSILTEKDSSGFRFIITSIGNNYKPKSIDSVIIKTSVHLLSGQSISSNSTFTFLASKLIKALQIELVRLGENAKVTLYVPSGLAYGAYPAGPIPKNSNLIIDLELVKVIPEYTGQLLKDIDLVNKYLLANAITAQTDVSGLRYKITTAASPTAINPLATDSVVINYTGKILSTGVVFDQSISPKGYRLSKSTTLKVWQKGLPLLKEGSTATFYVPSGLGFGSYEKFGVPPNTNLIFEVELVKVISK